MSESASNSVEVDGPKFDGGPTYEYTVVETDAGTNECTIFPRNCEEAEILTRWITAGEGAFTSLSTME